MVGIVGLEPTCIQLLFQVGRNHRRYMPMNICFNCRKETINLKFCSRSCANSYNNKLKPKRQKKVKLCIICGKPAKQYNNSNRTSKYCEDCALSLVKDHTLKEATYSRHHKSSAFALVRSRARKEMSTLPQICMKCGYDKHVEVCHIKPIRQFSEDTLLSVINDKTNLLLLCPNCHWEYDNK